MVVSVVLGTHERGPLGARVGRLAWVSVFQQSYLFVLGFATVIGSTTTSSGLVDQDVVDVGRFAVDLTTRGVQVPLDDHEAEQEVVQHAVSEPDEQEQHGLLGDPEVQQVVDRAAEKPNPSWMPSAWMT